MLTIQNYVRAASLEEAYKLNQQRRNRVVGGMLMDGKPVLSCSMLAARADGHEIHTLEGLQEEASGFVAFIADQGADQCGFCNPRLCDEHHRPAA